ncbi:MAG TPA: DUF1330 domain-containing protein [Xanthobacteraceae bacterium]|nr:DUF1330 domain-containing protein [Xanthobacteraceae bacterium]
MAGYLIANIEVRDPAAFAEYRTRVAPLIARFGGRYLIRGGEIQHREGRLPVERLVVLEFPSLADAQRFYESAEYAPLLELRAACTRSDVALVEGYAGESAMR